MALITGAAALTVVSGGAAYWYFGGKNTDPETEKEIKELKKKNELPKKDLIRELKEFRTKKLKDASKRSLKPRNEELSPLEKSLQNIREKVKFEN